jgi:hypothetical protein
MSMLFCPSSTRLGQYINPSEEPRFRNYLQDWRQLRKWWKRKTQFWVHCAATRTPWAACCNASPFLCLILSHENDVILAQVDNRRLWRQKRIKKRKETQGNWERYRMAASKEQEKRIAYAVTDVPLHCCAPFHSSTFISSSFLSRIYFFLSSLRYFDWLRCPSGKKKERRQSPRLHFFTFCPQLHIWFHDLW